MAVDLKQNKQIEKSCRVERSLVQQTKDENRRYTSFGEVIVEYKFTFKLAIFYLQLCDIQKLHESHPKPQQTARQGRAGDKEKKS